MGVVGKVALVLLGLVVVVIAGAWLALRRPDLPWSVLEAKYANAQSRYLDLPGGLHVHYRDQGRRDGPVVVMVHGFSASLEAWEPWVQRLSADYRVVTLDLPGHGLTRAPASYVVSIDAYADLVDQVARDLELGPYVVVGNSMGGAVAWDDALRHADDVRALVLVDAAGWPAARAGSASRKPRDDAPLVFKLLRHPLGRAILGQIDTRPMAESGLKAAYVDPALVTPELVSRYVDLSRGPGHRDILIQIQTMAPPRVTRETFRTIAVPTLVMHGEGDLLIPVDNGRAFAAEIPGAKLVTYPGVGHVPMEQIPGRSAVDLRAFLDALPPVKAPAAAPAS